MVAGHGREQIGAVHLAERGVVQVPFLVGAVVGEIAAVGDEIKIGQGLERGVERGGAFFKVFGGAGLHVGDFDEIDRVVRAAGFDRAGHGAAAVAHGVGELRVFGQGGGGDLVHPHAFPFFAHGVGQGRAHGGAAFVEQRHHAVGFFGGIPAKADGPAVVARHTGAHAHGRAAGCRRFRRGGREEQGGKQHNG